MKTNRPLAGMLAALMAAVGMTSANVPTFTPTPGRSKGKTKSNRRRTGKAGVYGRGLQNAWNRKRQDQQKKLNHLRDEHGAFTLVGRNPFTPRRKWLAGISAIRGF